MWTDRGRGGLEVLCRAEEVEASAQQGGLVSSPQGPHGRCGGELHDCTYVIYVACGSYKKGLGCSL
jgi:hypothetical protein